MNRLAGGGKCTCVSGLYPKVRRTPATSRYRKPRSFTFVSKATFATISGWTFGAAKPVFPLLSWFA